MRTRLRWICAKSTSVNAASFFGCLPFRCRADFAALQQSPCFPPMKQMWLQSQLFVTCCFERGCANCCMARVGVRGLSGQCDADRDPLDSGVPFAPHWGGPGWQGHGAEDLRPVVLLMADLQRDICIAANRCPGRSIKQRAPLMATLQRTRLYLEGHTLLDHKVDDLAAFAGLPARYLSRVFHAVYGLSPLSFAGRVRLDHAVRLLREGEMTLDQIAVTVGYKHRGTLLSALRAHLGLGRMDRIADVVGSESRQGSRPRSS